MTLNSRSNRSPENCHHWLQQWPTQSLSLRRRAISPMRRSTRRTWTRLYIWLSQFQRMLDDLPQGKQEPKHLHVQSLYHDDPDHFNRLDNDEKKASEEIRYVSLPPSRSKSHRQIGDMPAGLAWGGPHKGTGFDPKPNKEEWKVRRHNRLCTRLLAGVGAGDRELPPADRRLPAGP
jgi:hypothetical protein